ncbi:glycosyltransferase [Vibrio fluvialis]|uniref:glycosyltransferase family 2 protein n=1 Tax=Vibrio fluvialis TaxID=676 RepID=UPI001EEBDF05|nr:glycosyltransferase [Vibrio fluvialis]
MLIVTDPLPPKVSIVCAWYNRSEFLRDTLDSLLNQTFENYEIIIINDGSSDPNVKQILDTYSDDKLVVVHQNNTGFIGAIKHAISLAKGEFIAVQGAGDISLPNRINYQYELLSKNNNLVAVSCWVQTKRVDIDGIETTVGYLKNSIKVLNNSDFMKAKNPFTHGEVMFRKSIYDKVGGYREIFKFGQDRDLWLRLTQYGDCGIVKEVSYIRREFSKDGVSTDINKLLLQFKLTNLAKQCNVERNKLGSDLVDRYGIYAPFYFDRDISYNTKVLKQIYLCLKNGKKEESFIALREFGNKEYIFKLIANILITTYHLKFTKSLILSIVWLKRIFKK